MNELSAWKVGSNCLYIPVYISIILSLCTFMWLCVTCEENQDGSKFCLKEQFLPLFLIILICFVFSFKTCLHGSFKHIAIMINIVCRCTSIFMTKKQKQTNKKPLKRKPCIYYFTKVLAILSVGKWFLLIINKCIAAIYTVKLVLEAYETIIVLTETPQL